MDQLALLWVKREAPELSLAVNRAKSLPERGRVLLSYFPKSKDISIIGKAYKANPFALNLSIKWRHEEYKE